ncbi:DinB family protein [Mesobacillus foraminis]|uniref:Putative damage-inducible protein DinB n=1 Tax=Mesobacillus foraminis TaxID=279826 RepID=A0A4R2BLB4_9BACI|nr:DinB family protein [Mesobacillus foraminis]TCN28048.1 putative damage-inducible protein DinB [Mesobacillus foraminis]
MAILDGFVAGWLSHRKALIELVETFEDQHLDYKPWDNAMSVSELVLHITGATGMFVQTVKNGTFTPPAEQKAVRTVNELKDIIQAETDQTKADLESLTEEQLAKTVEFYGMNMPGMVLLENGKDHEVHHKGQLFTYARLVGIETLPFFVSRS